MSGWEEKFFKKIFGRSIFPLPNDIFAAKEKRPGTIPNLNLILYSSSPIGDRNASAISRTPKRKP